MVDQQTAPETSFEGYPLTRTEYITAMVHFYRGERSRADAWRNRLDPTTNWAVVTTAGMLSFTFGDPYHSHVPLLLANVLWYSSASRPGGSATSTSGGPGCG